MCGMPSGEHVASGHGSPGPQAVADRLELDQLAHSAPSRARARACRRSARRSRSSPSSGRCRPGPRDRLRRRRPSAVSAMKPATCCVDQRRAAPASAPPSSTTVPFSCTVDVRRQPRERGGDRAAGLEVARHPGLGRRLDAHRQASAVVAPRRPPRPAQLRVELRVARRKEHDGRIQRRVRNVQPPRHARMLAITRPRDPRDTCALRPASSRGRATGYRTRIRRSPTRRTVLPRDSGATSAGAWP